MNSKLISTAAVLAIAGGAAYFFLSAPDTNTASAESEIIIPELTANAEIGKNVFQAKCADCHGVNVGGTEQGPPLIHIYYEPNHHGDEAFRRAATMGVRAHHWRFGDMPPVEGISNAEIGFVINFVREVQKANGIF